LQDVIVGVIEDFQAHGSVISADIDFDRLAYDGIMQGNDLALHTTAVALYCCDVTLHLVQDVVEVLVGNWPGHAPTLARFP
jgi:hypothetical protein